MTTKRIAIIGGGVSGLVCAYLLQKDFDVHLFEQDDRLGGHANTVDVHFANEQHAVDTGFIVFNNRNYPNFQKLLEKLKINKVATEMSFSVKENSSGLEYNGHNLNTLFAQRKNLLNPKFLRFTLEILRFNKIALAAATNPAATPVNASTLREFLQQHHFIMENAECSPLLNWYLLPMAAAIWSVATESVLDFPAAFFIDFFKNHGLLELKNRPQWYSIQGGSRSYITAIQQQTQCQYHQDQAVISVKREKQSISLYTGAPENPQIRDFDEVVFACHSDQALKLLANPTPMEQKILSQLPYADNLAILHTDHQLMPQNKKAWASWNYWLPEKTPPANPSHTLEKPIVTYDMRRLQNLAKQSQDSPEILVSLNAQPFIDPDKIIQSFHYSHPQFQHQSHWAQKQWHTISGVQHTHYCGAYWFNGFHEDGVRSALRVAHSFGDYPL